MQGFLIILHAVALGTCFKLDDGDVSPTNSGFEVPTLRYGYDALEPYIDEQTMIIHHDKHHKGYVDNLNTAIEASGGALDGMGLTDLVKAVGTDAVPATVATKVRQNAGGHWNHSFYWKIMSPSGDGKKGFNKVFRKAIVDTFGGRKKFKNAFVEAASSVFGSGWAWLCVNGATGGLELTTTPNQDNPLMTLVGGNLIPILGIDVWEHAYYLKRQNVRADYINAFYEVINWNQVTDNYMLAQRGQVPNPTA